MSTPSISANTLQTQLNDIIEQGELLALFQPIVALSKQEIYGYEALIRGPSDSPLHAPINLFAAAERYGRLNELDHLCRKILIKQFAQLKLPGRLFLNINPSVLMSPNFKSGLTSQFLNTCGLDPNRVVIEITETQPIEEYHLIRNAIEHYRKEGFIIAIDDLGAGYSGLKLWSEMQPDFVKIDRHFISGVDTDKVKRQFIHSIIEMSRTLGCHVIAEGVETKAEYTSLRKLGAEFSQGYYFARPSAEPKTLIEPKLFRTEEERATNVTKSTAACLLQYKPCIAATCSVRKAAEIFMRSPTLNTIAVVLNERPIGLLVRNQLMDLYAHRFGSALYSKKPVHHFIEKNYLSFESHTPLEIISKRLTKALDVHLDDFILVEKGYYKGMGTLLDLLQAITQQQLELARYANPLTMLPGNVPIMRELQGRLDTRQAFVAAYCDLDHFKPYNDSYGYTKGDEVILMFSDILRRNVCNKNDFIGHIGGDDFILFFSGEDWETCCNEILSEFSAEIPHCYNVEDRHNKCVIAKGRDNQDRCFPHISLSIGSVRLSATDFPQTSDAISKAVTDAKAMAKRKTGNAHIICSPPALGHASINLQHAING
ncbi:hypothetical protein A9Q89_03085 [Gammaproteobacteria bacterium 53_120_T64]|nr:hypothetical protein A9Q89_03085 [Gammaproteobacteria bacterium 53_120_T64]